MLFFNSPGTTESKKSKGNFIIIDQFSNKKLQKPMDWQTVTEQGNDRMTEISAIILPALVLPNKLNYILLMPCLYLGKHTYNIAWCELLQILLENNQLCLESDEAIYYFKFLEGRRDACMVCLCGTASLNHMMCIYQKSVSEGNYFQLQMLMNPFAYFW